MKTNLADGKTLKEMFAAGVDWLEKSAPDINAINVFPVPDGDTGTNMVLTMRSAMQEAARNTNGDVSSVTKSIAYGALMGARGNSGVILSQFWRGLSKGLEGRTYFNGKEFAKALNEASQTAYEGIVNPVEGTILTVLKDTSNAAEEAAKKDDTLISVLEAAVKSAEDSVARTPNLLPVLKEAGVVDAGGQGLYVLLNGALKFLQGESHKIDYWKPRLIAAESELAPKTAHMPTELEVPYGYCTNFVLEGQNINLRKISKDLNKKGQSLIVTGDASLVRVHIHSFEPGEILTYAARLGKLHQIDINNMDDQYAEFIKMQKERMPSADIIVVTVATGDGFYQIFQSLGSSITVPGGQTMNPSIRELLQAVESAPSDNVIILPNNKNIILSASQIQPLTSKKVKVVPTKTISQGITALLAFNYDMNLEQNARIMEQAISTIKTLEITKAVRKTQYNGLKIKKGQFIAILNDEEIISSGDKISDVIFEALEKSSTEKAETASIYYGAGIKPAEADTLAQEIRDKYKAEVQLIHGGQPHYDYIISLE